MKSDDGGDSKKSRSDALSEAVKRAEQAVLKARTSQRNRGSGIKITPMRENAPSPKLPPPTEKPSQPVSKEPEAIIEEPSLELDDSGGAAESMDFGMVDLGSGRDSKAEVVPETQTSVKEPQQVSQAVPQPVIKPAMAPKEPVADSTPDVPDQPPMAPGSPGSPGPSALIKESDLKQLRKEKSRYEPVTLKRPRRSYKRELKYAAIVLVIAAVVGGAVFGIIKWRASSKAEHMAKQKQLNSRSLDSLKDQKLRNEGLK